MTVIVTGRYDRSNHGVWAVILSHSEGSAPKSNGATYWG